MVTLNGAEANVACPSCIPSSASAMNIVLPVPKEIFLFAASNEKLVAVKLLPSIVNPAIVPPVNCTVEPVIWPLSFNIKLSFEDFISSSLTTNPPIDAERNAAKPLESILELAFAAVAGEPPIVAGVNIELALTLPSIVTPSVIVPPLINTWEPVILPRVSTWNLDDDIKKSASDAPSNSKELPCLSFVPSIVNPAIVPPVNCTVEPVIWPLDFNLKLPPTSFISPANISNPDICCWVLPKYTRFS